MISGLTSSANTSTLPINTAAAGNQLGSVEEAADFLAAVLLERGNRLIGMIKNQLDSTEIYFSKMDRLADLMGRLISRTSGSFVPVTLDNLAATPKTREALRTLISSAGPTLGNTVAEADDLIAELAQSNVSIRAPGQTLVLMETWVATESGGNGTPLRKTLKWLSDEEVKLIRERTSRVGVSPTYPGAHQVDSAYRLYSDEERKWIPVNERTTIFTDYRVRRPDTADLAAAINTLRAQFDNVLALFSEALVQTNEAISKLDQQVRNRREASEEALRTIEEFKQKRNEDIIDFLRVLRRYREVKAEPAPKSEKAQTNIDGQSGVPAAIANAESTKTTAQAVLHQDVAQIDDSLVTLSPEPPRLADLTANKLASAADIPPPGVFAASLASLRSVLVDLPPGGNDVAAGLAPTDAQTMLLGAAINVASQLTGMPPEQARASTPPFRNSLTSNEAAKISDGPPADVPDRPALSSAGPGRASPEKE